MAELRLYLIGAGAIARRHADAAQQLPLGDTLRLSVADPNPTALEQFQALFPQAAVYASAEAMLAEPARETDIVIVATPPAAHAEPAIAALAGGRHVLCEKPLAFDEEQATLMLSTARAHGRLLGCCSSRFLGVATTGAVKDLLREGRLGRPYHMRFIHRLNRARPGLEYQPESPWFLDRSRSGGGVLMDWGPYDVSLLNDLLAPQAVEVLAAWSATPQTELQPAAGVVFDVEHHVGASLRYHLQDGGVLAVSYERAACTHGEEQSTAEIEGTAGAVRWDWLCWPGHGEVVLSEDRQGRLCESRARYEDAVPLHGRALLSFQQAVRGQPSTAVLGEQALFNFRCLRAIYTSAATGRPVVVRRDAQRS